MAEIKFEEALAKLEKVVADLESSSLELEARLKKFEEGTKLARQLLTRLEGAKKKVEILVKASAVEPVLTEVSNDNFDTDETGEPGTSGS